VELEVGTSTQPIPVHFSFAEHDHIEGSLSAERRQLMRDVFDLPDLAAMDDGIANGTWEPARRAQPLALFTAPRVDYSLHRLRHYTGTAPEHFQNFVLFTNYQFYIDEFAWPRAMPPMADPRSEYIAFVEPGNVVTRRAACRAAARRRTGRRAAAPAADAGLPPGARPTAAASPWSTSASARPTPRPSPTTSPCCARTPG
jgi:AMP nucleosidase